MYMLEATEADGATATVLLVLAFPTIEISPGEALMARYYAPRQSHARARPAIDIRE